MHDSLVAVFSETLPSAQLSGLFLDSETTAGRAGPPNSLVSAWSNSGPMEPELPFMGPWRCCRASLVHVSCLSLVIPLLHFSLSLLTRVFMQQVHTTHTGHWVPETELPRVVAMPLPSCSQKSEEKSK